MMSILRLVRGLMALRKPGESRSAASSLVRPIAIAGVLTIGIATGPFAVPAAQAQTSLPVIVADFNHDGIPDALVLSSTGPSATIVFGSVPYGSFAANGQTVTFPAVCGALPQSSVLVGDFNNDGFPDIAFLCASTAGVMLGNGDGTFGTVKTITGLSSATSGVVGDFNKDGKLDIVALVSFSGNLGTSQSLEFLAGNGDGTFAGPVVSNLDTNTYSAPVAPDVNGDGFPDIVLLNSPVDGSASLAVFGHNTDGSFGTAYQSIVTANVTADLGVTAVSPTLVGNFFSPSETDFVVPSTGANAGLVVIQNTSTATSYSLGTPTTVAFTGLTGAMAGNFTGSGYTDIVAANGTSLAVLANSGDGTGTFAASYSALTVPSTSFLFAVADANGDGYSDIYTAVLSQTGALQLAVNVTTGTATATSQPVPLNPGAKTITAAWPGNVNFTGSNATGTQQVNGLPAVVTVSSSSDPIVAGNAVTLTASVMPGVDTNVIPTGTVTLVDGATTLATGMLSSEVFSFTTSALAPGSHSIVAMYSGDSFFAPSTSPVFVQVVSHGPAVASNLTWATPAAIVYGTPLSATQLDAVAVDGTGAAIPGVYTYAPAAGTVLDVGSRTLTVTFTPADLTSFNVASGTVVLTVTQAKPVVTWVTPASIAYGVPLSANQLDATVAGVSGTALAGTFTYTPAAGAVLNPGAQMLTVSFAPTNTLDYTAATGSVTLTVAGVSVASAMPATATLGDPATTITLSGAGFVATSVVQVNKTAIPTTFVNATTLTAIIPASYFATVGTLQITVFDPTVSLTSPGVAFNVVAPAVSATVSAPSTTDPGSQPMVTITIDKPYPIDLTVTLTLGFAASTTPPVDDPNIQFAGGGRTLTFVVPANSTTVPTIQLQSGTVAGTITIPVTLTAAGMDVTPTTLVPVVITVPPAVPTISGMTVARSGNQLTVVIHGFSNTRQMATATFDFTAAAGAQLGTTNLTIPADTIFGSWYTSTPSDQYGSSFTYTQIFTVSDLATDIASVQATLTNSVGVSTSTTAQ